MRGGRGKGKLCAADKLYAIRKMKEGGYTGSYREALSKIGGDVYQEGGEISTYKDGGEVKGWQGDRDAVNLMHTDGKRYSYNQLRKLGYNDSVIVRNWNLDITPELKSRTTMAKPVMGFEQKPVQNPITRGEAFKQARAAGEKEFTYEGKRYTTELASDKNANISKPVSSEEGRPKREAEETDGQHPEAKPYVSPYAAPYANMSRKELEEHIKKSWTKSEPYGDSILGRSTADFLNPDEQKKMGFINPLEDRPSSTSTIDKGRLLDEEKYVLEKNGQNAKAITHLTKLTSEPPRPAIEAKESRKIFSHPRAMDNMKDEEIRKAAGQLDSIYAASPPFNPMSFTDQMVNEFSNMRFDHNTYHLPWNRNAKPDTVIVDRPTTPTQSTTIEFQEGGEIPEYQDGSNIKTSIYNKYPAMSSYEKEGLTIVPDTNFTREATGAGSIEYLSPTQDTVRYNTGYKLPHPSLGKHAVYYNPKTNNQQNIELDMLHGMPTIDSEYKNKRSSFEESFRKGNQKEMDHWYEKAAKEGKAADGRERWEENYVDGVIRNLLFEGTTEDFKKNRYWEGAKDYYLKNSDTNKSFKELKEYLKTPKNLKEGGDVSEMGYRDDSPYKNRKHIDINTPTGEIDMSNTGTPLFANGRYLAPYSGKHQFNDNVVREIPVYQDGGEEKKINKLKKLKTRQSEIDVRRESGDIKTIPYLLKNVILNKRIKGLERRIDKSGDAPDGKNNDYTRWMYAKNGGELPKYQNGKNNEDEEVYQNPSDWMKTYEAFHDSSDAYYWGLATQEKQKEWLAREKAENFLPYTDYLKFTEDGLISVDYPETVAKFLRKGMKPTQNTTIYSPDNLLDLGAMLLGKGDVPERNISTSYKYKKPTRPRPPSPVRNIEESRDIDTNVSATSRSNVQRVPARMATPVLGTEDVGTKPPQWNHPPGYMEFTQGQDFRRTISPPVAGQDFRNKRMATPIAGYESRTNKELVSLGTLPGEKMIEKGLTQYQEGGNPYGEIDYSPQTMERDKTFTTQAIDPIRRAKDIESVESYNAEMKEKRRAEIQAGVESGQMFEGKTYSPFERQMAEQVSERQMRSGLENPEVAKKIGWNLLELGLLPLSGPTLPLKTTGKAVNLATKGVKAGTKAIKKAKQEAIYSAINPVGYGAKEKIKNAIPNIYKYTLNPDKKVYDMSASFMTDKKDKKSLKLISDILEDYDKNPADFKKMYDALPDLEKMDMPSLERMDEIIKLSKNRQDAWRIGLGLDQKSSTFVKKGDNYTIKNMKTDKYDFSSIHKDILAKEEGSKLQFGDAVNPLKEMTYEHKALNPNQRMIMQMERSGFSRSGPDLKPKTKSEYIKSLPSWKQNRIVEKSAKKDFDYSAFDNDHRHGIMGGFRWDVKKLSDGKLHFQSNDTWDLHPWAERGISHVKEKEAIEMTKKMSKYYKKVPKGWTDKHKRKGFEDIEMLNVLGGKPYNIQNNFIVDPQKGYKVIKKYKSGGKL